MTQEDFLLGRMCLDIVTEEKIRDLKTKDKPIGRYFKLPTEQDTLA